MSNESREGSDQMLIWKTRYHPLQNIVRNIKSKARQKRKASMPFHVLGADAGNLFLQGGDGHWGLSLCSFGIFLLFPYLPQSYVFSRSTTRQATCTQYIFYQTLCSVLLRMNENFVKFSNFINRIVVLKRGNFLQN